MKIQRGFTTELLAWICPMLLLLTFGACGGGGGETGGLTVHHTAAPAITVHPGSQTVLAGQAATFFVTATGDAPLTYQWKKNNVNIDNATAASYTTPATALSDSGSKFSVAVTNTAGHADSAEATLNVTASEFFAEDDRPVLEYNTTGDYFLVTPWNYEKGYNASRQYPLLIYLHGSSQTQYLKNLYYMGMGYYDSPGFTEEYQKGIADTFRKTYPCFTYVPQGPSGWNTATLISQIEALKTNYRIDPNRIYIHGFSMGGSGSYALAKAYVDYNGQLFAGIIRLSGGGSLSSSYNEILEKTAIWIVTGATDLSSAQSAYDYLKNHALNAGAVENYSGEYIVTSLGTNYPARTWTLTKSGWPCAKMTYFPNAGHFTTAFPFGDPSVMAWLFSQSLLNR